MEDPKEDKSPHEELARWRKIARLFAALTVHNVPAAFVLSDEDKQWGDLALAAGVRVPSETTRQLMRDVVREVAETAHVRDDEPEVRS